MAWSLGLQSVLTVATGDWERGARLARECQIAAVASGELWLQSPGLSSLANHAALSEGDYERACRLTEEALELFRRKGDKWGVGIHLLDLAFFRLLAGHYAQAEAPSIESMLLFHELADRWSAAYAVCCFAGAQAGQRRSVRAVRLWGAMEGLLESVGSRLQSIYKETIGDRFVDPFKESLGEEAFQTVLAEGRAMSLTQVVQYALADTADDLPPDDASSGPQAG